MDYDIIFEIVQMNYFECLLLGILTAIALKSGVLLAVHAIVIDLIRRTILNLQIREKLNLCSSATEHAHSDREFFRQCFTFDRMKLNSQSKIWRLTMELKNSPRAQL